jgi:hypothetical protein
MGESILYTISCNDDIIAANVKAEYVPIIIKGLLAEWYLDSGLELKVTAQNLERKSLIPRI